MNIEAYHKIVKELESYNAKLCAVSKTKPVEDLKMLQKEGQKVFGENKAQEMTAKFEELGDDDYSWHMIGHMQRNKVKYIAPYVDLIHGVDSLRLFKQIEKEGRKAERKLKVLIQMHIAEEDSKFGFDRKELEELLNSDAFVDAEHVQVCGLMGMATFTEDEKQIGREFASISGLYEELKKNTFKDSDSFNELSIGMSGDYKIALDHGSTMVRIGSKIFGPRN